MLVGLVFFEFSIKKKQNNNRQTNMTYAVGPSVNFIVLKKLFC